MTKAPATLVGDMAVACMRAGDYEKDLCTFRSILL